MQTVGAGKIIVNSVNRDRQMKGYDLHLARRMREVVKVPLTLLGGAGSLDDMTQLIRERGLVGAAAGCLFVLKGSYRAVLLNYPTEPQKTDMFCAAGVFPAAR